MLSEVSQLNGVQFNCSTCTRTDLVKLCSKCNTHISKQQWPSWALINALDPGGQFGEEGSVIHFPFPVQHVMHQLPRESELISQRHTFQKAL